MPTSTARSTRFLLERFSPKQILSITFANRRINLWEGAVSSGKTIASLWAWLMFVERASTSGELVMIGKTRDAVYRNALQPLMNPEIFEDLALQVDYNPGAPTARIFGRLVHVIGANDVKSENKIRGMTCVGAYVDEGTLLPETFWDMLRTRMRAPGARIFATTNPDAPSHWLREKFIDDPEVRRSMKVFSFELDDNIHLTADYVEETKRMYSGLFYRRFILGEWCAAEGAVFDMFDRSRHVVDILPPITRWLALGVDYGTSNPTHAVLLGIGQDGCLYAAADWRYDGRHQVLVGRAERHRPALGRPDGDIGPRRRPGRLLGSRRHDSGRLPDLGHGGHLRDGGQHPVPLGPECLRRHGHHRAGQLAPVPGPRGVRALRTLGPLESPR
ncbi:phage terminase large subunit [Streptomyces californicus]|uniref:phage terminase large subunit n=1 Tax=Streptomyces californicus TaxID=67351 RepID=UPI00296F5CAF|nr:phage terminase large subunit [Streptomyces californicus]MDW4902886.1 phage terminase large subunit [Streptomyces californicus]